jgi:hypothetical protein
MLIPSVPSEEDVYDVSKSFLHRFGIRFFLRLFLVLTR